MLRTRLSSLLNNQANFTSCVFALTSLYKLFDFQETGNLNFLLSHLDQCGEHVSKQNLRYLKIPLVMLLCSSLMIMQGQNHVEFELNKGAVV